MGTRRWAMMIGGLVGCLVMGACERGVSDRSLRYVNPHEAIGLVAGREALLGLGQRKAGVYVDPRPRAAFEAGHIPGAVHLPFDRVRDGHAALKIHGVLVVYGEDYNDALALALSKRLLELGHPEVHTLRGGLRAWTTAGNALATGPE